MHYFLFFNQSDLYGTDSLLNLQFFARYYKFLKVEFSFMKVNGKSVQRSFTFTSSLKLIAKIISTCNPLFLCNEYCK